MKKLICSFMAISFLFCMTACTVQTSLESPVTFYYPRVEYTYGSADSVIAQETREAAALSGDTAKLIGLYLLGPVDTALRSPFPDGTSLVSCRQEKDGLHVVLSDEFAALISLELTVACTSLAATCMKITEVGTVHIHAETMMLDAESTVTIHADSIAFLDYVSTDTITETQAG